MKLDYITKGNRNSRGKSKIYFCGHPADYDATFKSIVKDILERPDCTIWYDTEPEADWDKEQYFNDIFGMQLFVIPVTENFLCKKNRAFSNELPFAVEKHIPILPIIEDNRLEYDFEKKCGNLQSIKKTVRGPDAIPYKDRLKKFLDQILIGVELSQKIQESFDAEIFMAYRKEDRKFAHQFMRVIHENPCFRNIAIWYDEFLNVGNDYSAEIDEAIQSSNAFVMIVTPNILTNGAYNYVKEQEYSLAVHLGKKIIPVQFIEVERDKLEEDYEGIANCISIDNKGELYNTLQSVIVKTDSGQNAIEPQRQFLLGLAYLSGTGVEKNPEYAVSLILSAAEDGLPEAVERLTTMYYYGEAVARSLASAIVWQNRLVEYYQNKYKETGERQSGIKVIHEQHELFEYYMEAGKDMGALEVCTQMKRFSSELRRKYPQDYSAIECLGISLSDVSDFLYKHNDLKKAKLIRLSLKFLNKQLTRDTGIFDAKENLMINYQQLGSVSEENGNFQTALKYYQQSLAITEKMKEENGSDALYLRWLNDVYRVGHCYLRLGLVEKAEIYLQKCIKGYTSLANVNSELWRTYDALSKVCCQKKQLDRAMFYCDKGIHAAKQETGLAGQRHLADSYALKADILRVSKQNNDAELEYLLAVEMLQDISSMTDEYEDRERAWRIYGMFGDYYLTTNNTVNAKKYYQKSMDEINRLHSNDRKWQAEMGCAQAYQRLGLIARRESEFDLAKTYFANSISILNRIRKQSSDPFILFMLNLAKQGLKALEEYIE